MIIRMTPLITTPLELLSLPSSDAELIHWIRLKFFLDISHHKPFPLQFLKPGINPNSVSFFPFFPFFLDFKSFSFS